MSCFQAVLEGPSLVHGTEDWTSPSGFSRLGVVPCHWPTPTKTGEVMGQRWKREGEKMWWHASPMRWLQPRLDFDSQFWRIARQKRCFAIDVTLYNSAMTSLHSILVRWWWLERWTCNQQAAVSTPGCCINEYSDPGQVVHMCPAPLKLRPYGDIEIWVI